MRLIRGDDNINIDIAGTECEEVEEALWYQQIFFCCCHRLSCGLMHLIILCMCGIWMESLSV
jgi:hypothetical protein